MSKKQTKEHAVDCKSVDLHLEAFLDGELESEQTSLIENHLLGCSACQSGLELARTLTKELRSLPTLQCPPTVVEEVRTRTRPTQIKFSRPLRGKLPSSEQLPATGTYSNWLRAAVLLTVCGAGLLAGTFLLRDLEQGRRQAQNPPTTFTNEELAQAEEELRFALSLFGGIAQKAGLVLRDEVLAKRVAEPPRRALSMFGTARPSAPSTTDPL